MNGSAESRCCAILPHWLPSADSRRNLLVETVVLTGERTPTAVGANGRIEHRELTNAPKWLILLLRMASDGALAGIAFVIAYWLRFSFNLGGEIPPESQQPLSFFLDQIIVFMVLSVVVFQSKGLYRLPRWASLLDEAWGISSGVVIAMAMVILTAFFQRFYPSRLVFIAAIPIAIALMLGARMIARTARERLWSRGIGVDRVAVVGSGRAARRIMQWMLSQPQLGYEVVGYVADNPSPDGVQIATPNAVRRPIHLGTVSDLLAVVRARRIDELIIALPPREHERIVEVIDLCRQIDVDFKLVPDLYTMALDHVNIHEVEGMPLIGLKEPEISGWNFVVKRVMDISISLFVLVVFSWLFALIAIAIKLDSKGTVLFSQIRVGRDGKRFVCYKFRTMVSDAEAQRAKLEEVHGQGTLLFKLKDDPRRTRVGGVLRRSSLDELPQFINILLGHMSIVGPRPAIPPEVDEYEDWHFDRLLVPPGLTGLWQVNGRSNLSFDEMVRLDLYYAENWSPWLDIKTIIRTVPAIVTARGAY
jgi:exopolysaccharide biosynthesis polyprenyl glycosylphosphotransferase